MPKASRHPTSAAKIDVSALNFYYGNGVNSFVQANLQGGEGMFGVGAKVGARVAW